MKILKFKIHWGSKNIFKKKFSNILAVEEKVVQMENNYIHKNNSLNTNVLQDSKNLFNLLQAQEEIFWKHKTADKKLCAGDKNTNYFHASIKRKRSQNYMHNISLQNGVTYDNEDNIISMGINLFENLFNKIFHP